MYPAEIVRYMGELGRVLRPGGRALTAFFALDETWREAQLAGRGALPMPHVLEASCRYHDADDPLHAIGYTPAWIRDERAAEETLRSAPTAHWSATDERERGIRVRQQRVHAVRERVLR